MYERAEVVIDKLGNFNQHYKNEFMKKSPAERQAYKADIEQMCVPYSKEQVKSAVLNAIATHTLSGVPNMGNILKRCGETTPAKSDAPIRVVPRSMRERHSQEHVAALDALLKTPKGTEEAREAWLAFNKMRERHAKEEMSV